MNDSTKIYTELYRRKEFDKIPVFEDETGIYYLHEKQLQALGYLWDDTTIFVGYGGAGMSGKTQLEVFYNLFNALVYPDTRWLIGRKEYGDLEQSVIKTISKTFKFYGLQKGVDYTYNGQTHTYYFTNSSEIILTATKYYPSDSLMTTYGGYEVTGITIDESVETDIRVIDILATRIGRWNNAKYGLKKKFFEAFNPAKNHVHSRYWGPYKANKETIYTKFIPALPSDNPHPEVEDWVKTILATSNSITKERLIYGNFDYDDDPYSLISYDDIEAIFTNDHLDKQKNEHIIICDVARYGSDRAIITVWQSMKMVDVIIFKTSATTDIQKAINAMRAKYKVPLYNVLVDDDGVGGGVVDNTRATGFVNNSRAWDKQYYNLKSECGYKLAEMINDIFIEYILADEEIEKIKEELGMLKTYDSDKDGKLRILPKEKIKEKLGRSPDWLDIFIMRMYYHVMPGRRKRVL